MDLPGRFEARLTGAGALRSLLLGGSLGLIGVISVLLFFVAGHSFTLLLCALVLWPFALLTVAVTLFQYFSRRPTLALDADGVHHVVNGSVAWRDVVGLSLFVFRGRTEGFPMLAVGLAEGAQVRGGAPWAAARRAPLGLRIALRGLDQPPDRILEVARALRDEVSPPRLEDWYFGMSRERQAAHRDSQRLLAGLAKLGDRASQHATQDASELRQLTQGLDAHAAELERLQGVESRQFRRRMRLAWAALALCLLLFVLRVWLH
jgi:hypothetical protein